MRRRFAAGLALGVATIVASVTVGPGTTAPTASALPGDVVAVVIEGTGNGHGRGLSQWGAYGYAVDHGWDWNQILEHYYGGTRSTRIDPGSRIEVRLLAGDGARTVGVVSNDSPVVWKGISRASMYAEETSAGVFRVYGSSSRACPGASSMTVPDGPEVYAPSTYVRDVELVQAFLKAHHDPSIFVDGYFGPQTSRILASWQTAQGLPVNGQVWNADDAARARQIINAAGSSVTWTLLGTHTQSTRNPVRFTSTSGEDPSSTPGEVLGLCNGSGGVTHYRGAIEFLHTDAGNRVVNDVEVEDYLRGVVPKEVSASWANAGGGAGVHALRAQAVAARSYGLAQNRSYTYPGSSVRYATTCDSSSCQVYGGAGRRATATGSLVRVEDARTDAAIAATERVVRTWPNGSVVSTEFSASNGPRTAGGAFPPVDDIGDDTANNPNHRWTRVLDADDLAARYGLGTLTGASMVESSNAVYQQFDGIWFNDIVLTGTNGTFRDDAWDFRRTHGLRSPGFTVRVVTRSTVGGSVAFVGDSVGNSVAGELRTVTDGTFSSLTIDAVDGRCTTRVSCPGTSGVEAVASLPANLDLVVVELGYNDDPATFRGDVDAMMAALVARGTRRVLWVDLADIRTSGGASVYGPANAALAAAEREWSQLTVVDWNAASAGPERPRWFTDGVHLSLTGQAEFALWVRQEMLVELSQGRLAPARRIRIPIG
jgi:peptidoglycan hydrolase-like protein with peptidoglycan-binding domain